MLQRLATKNNSTTTIISSYYNCSYFYYQNVFHRFISSSSNSLRYQTEQQNQYNITQLFIKKYDYSLGQYNYSSNNYQKNTTHYQNNRNYNSNSNSNNSNNNNNSESNDSNNQFNVYDYMHISRKNPLDLTVLDKSTDYNSDDYLALKEYFKTRPTTAEAFVSQLFKERSNNLVPVLKWVVFNRYLSNALFNQLFQLAITQKNSRFIIPFINMLNSDSSLSFSEQTIDVMINNYFFDDKTSDVATLQAHTIQAILEHPRCNYRTVAKVLRNIRNRDTIATLLLYNEIHANIPSTTPVDPLNNADHTGYSLIQPKHKFHSRIFENLLKLIKDNAVQHIFEKVILNALKIERHDLALLWLARRYHHHQLIPNAAVLKWFMVYFRFRREYTASRYWDDYYLSFYTQLPDVESALISQFIQFQPNRLLLNLPVSEVSVIDEQLRIPCSKPVRPENIAKTLINVHFRNNQNIYSLLPGTQFLMPALCSIHNSEKIDIVEFVNAIPSLLKSVIATPSLVSPLLVGSVERGLRLLYGNPELLSLYSHSYQIWNSIILGLVNALRFDLVANVVNVAIQSEIRLEPSTCEFVLAKMLDNMDIIDKKNLELIENCLVSKKNGSTTAEWTQSMLNCRLTSLLKSGDTNGAIQVLHNYNGSRNALTNELSTDLYISHKSRLSSLSEERASLAELLEFARVKQLDGGMLQTLLNNRENGVVASDIIMEYIHQLIENNNQEYEISMLVLHELVKFLDDDADLIIQLFKSVKPNKQYPSETKRIILLANEVVNDSWVNSVLNNASNFKIHPVLPAKPTCTLSNQSIDYLENHFLKSKLNTDIISEFNSSSHHSYNYHNSNKQ